MAVHYNPKITTDGLVLCLDAGNVKSYPGSGSFWYDLSGNRFHMSLKNSPTFVQSGNLKYFDLNGTSHHGISDGTVPDSRIATAANMGIDGSKPKTVVCIAMVDDGVGSTQAGLFDFGSYTGVTGENFCLRLNNSFIAWRAQFWSTPDYDFNYDTRARWTMFSVVYGTDRVGRTYGNEGVLLGQDTDGAQTLAVTNSVPFNMGRWAYNGSYFGGKIAYCAVYNKGLSVAEIRQNFNAVRGRYGI